MKRLAATAIALLMTAATGAAAAGPYGYGLSFENGPFGRGYYDYARVVSAQPIVEIVNQPLNVQRCYAPGYADRGYYNRGGDRDGDDRSSRVGGDLVGALIGGALGNTVGKGDGRKAATVVGAVAGYAVADHVQRDDRDNDRRYGHGDQGYYGNQRCQVVTEYRPERRVVGYYVTYDYRGRIEQVRTGIAPGNDIWVRVAV